MKYPKLPIELNRRIKLSPEDIERAKELRRFGLTYKEIGVSLEVHSSTIYYHLNTKYAEVVKYRVRTTQRYRWINDPAFRERRLKEGAKSKAHIRKDYIEAKEYKRFTDKVYRLKKKSLTQNK